MPWFALAYLTVQRRFDRPICDRRLWFVAGGLLAPFLFLGTSLPHLGRGLVELGSLPAVGASRDPTGRAGAMLHDAIAHLPVFAEWYFGYGGVALAVLLVLATIAAWLTPVSAAWPFGLGWIITVGAGALIYHLPYARYEVPDHVPLILFLAVSLGALSQPMHRWIAGLVTAATLGLWVNKDLQIARSPRTADIPKNDLEQYVTGPWSGNGVRRIATFLQDYATQHQQPCLVFTHHYARPGCYGLMLAARHNLQLVVVPHSITRAADLSAIDAAVSQAPRILGRTPAVFILAEGPELPELAILRTAGATTTPVLDVLREDGVSRFVLLSYEPRR